MSVQEIRKTYEVARAQLRQVMIWNVLQGVLDVTAITAVFAKWPFWVMFAVVVLRIVPVFMILRIPFVFGHPAGKWREAVEIILLLAVVFIGPFWTMTTVGVGFHTLAPQEWLVWPLGLIGLISVGPFILPVLYWMLGVLEWFCGWTVTGYTQMINISEETQVKKIQGG